MKKLCSLLLILTMLFALAACDTQETVKKTTKPSDATPETTTPVQETEPEVVPAETDPAQTEPTEATEPEATEYPMPPEETEPAETEPVETEPEATEKFPYTEYVGNKNQPIYSGPGYDYEKVGTVGTAARYTIVEEKEDSEGYLWGKLKSGAGWINLTNVRYSVGHWEEAPLLTGYYVASDVEGDQFFLYDESEYAVRVAFTAGADLYYRLYEGEITEELAPGKNVTMGHLEEGQTLVVQMAFPGDFTTYLMEVETGKDVFVWYKIYQSGEDGSLVCVPLT